MHILRRPSLARPEDRGAVVAIGNFDGIHLGHQAVIGAAAERARAGQVPHAVLTFEPHPRSVFQPQSPPFRLTPFRVKAQLLRQLGVDLMVSLRFDEKLAQRSAEDFVREILVEGLAISHAVVGYDFVFGNRRRGTAELLTALGEELGFAVTTVGPVRTDGEIFSSTRIRELLQAGRPREAAALLGRPWEIDGRVQTGDQRGRTIGFPTANFLLVDYLRPAAGVYAVRAALGRDGIWLPGVANFGRRPTFGGTDLRMEVHLFDFAEDIYGEAMRVQLIDYIRPEQKFPGLEALKAQISADGARAREILGTARAAGSD